MRSICDPSWFWNKKINDWEIYHTAHYSADCSLTKDEALSLLPHLIQKMLNKLLEDSKTIPQTFLYKLDRNILITIEEQQEALTKPGWSYWFARANIPDSDIKALQAKACEDPYYAYCFARDIVGADIKYCQEYVCQDPYWAYYFARYVPGADKKFLKKHIDTELYNELECYP